MLKSKFAKKIQKFQAQKLLLTELHHVLLLWKAFNISI